MLATAGLGEHLAVDVADAQALRAKAAANDPEALRAAAKQFEAMVVQNLLKTMRETHFTTEDDPFAPSESLKLYSELLDQQWAQKMTQGRGLGFANMILKHLAGNGGPAPQDAPLAGPTGDAVRPTTTEAPSQAPPAPLTLHSDKPAGMVRADSDKKRQFLEAMRPHAELAEKTTGVPARFILAHAALESGWGEREITAADGRPTYNLFGIKANGNWTGESVESITTEYRHGLRLKTSERFRAYGSYADAFNDYAGMLGRRYGDALQSGKDARAFADAVAAGGYATDPAYTAKLRRVIDSVARAGV